MLTGFVAALAVLSLAAGACRPAPGAPEAPQPPKPAVKEIRWGTSAVGSTGHRFLTALATFLNKEMPDYKITVLPTPGAIFSVKGFTTQELDGMYGADIAFYELVNNMGRFEGFKAQMKRCPVQSLWTFTVEVGVAIHSRDRDRIKQWRDLTGQPVFTGPLPWDVRAHLERALAALGVEHRYVEMDLGLAGSALERGEIRGVLFYTNALKTTAPWLLEVSLSTDMAVLNPSPEELEMLRKAGLYPVEVDVEPIFKKDLYVDKAVLFPFYYGFHVGLDVPADDVYRMLTLIEANLDELVKAEPGFAQLAEDMPGFQRRAVEATIDLVPVHPGLARYMKERGVWDPKWDNRIATEEMEPPDC